MAIVGTNGLPSFHGNKDFSFEESGFSVTENPNTDLGSHAVDNEDDRSSWPDTDPAISCSDTASDGNINLETVDFTSSLKALL